MTTRIVGGTVTRADGVPISSAPVLIELVLAKAFVVTGAYSMAGILKLQTAADGTWSTPLQCNDDLTPVGTLYQVTEKVPSVYGGTKTYLIQVLTLLPAGVNQVAGLVVPAAVPVGGTYSPVATPGPPGPTGSTGPQGIQGTPGYITVADNAALNAYTPKTTGLPIWVLSTGLFWVWNGTFYEVENIPRFATQAAADAAMNSVSQHKGQPFYLQTGAGDEGPMWRNSNNTYTRPWHMPWGMIGMVMGPTTTTVALTATPATVLTLSNVPLIRRRNYLFSTYCRAVIATANTSCRLTFQGFTPPATVTNTTLGLDHYETIIGNILSSVKVTMPFTVSVDANYTFPVAAIVQAGTGTYYPGDGGYVRIDDVGPAGAPL